MSKEFIIETSAHHIHVTQEALETLFGKGYELEVKKMLSQPGQFASNSRLDVVYHAEIKDRVTGEISKKDFTLKNLSILGPVRKENQVEISLTEARSIKASVPIRESGDIKGSCPCTLVNPLNGNSVDIKEGMIVAKRHIQMTENDAKEYNVKNGEIVSVEIKSKNNRSAILGDVVIRVSNSYALAMHIDTDEANALGGDSSFTGNIVKTSL